MNVVVMRIVHGGDADTDDDAHGGDAHGGDADDDTGCNVVMVAWPE